MIRIQKVGIIPGYDKVDPVDETDRFTQHRIVKQVRLEFSDGSSFEASFERRRDMQFVQLPQAISILWVRIVILSTYPLESGVDARDFTPISEVQVQTTHASASIILPTRRPIVSTPSITPTRQPPTPTQVAFINATDQAVVNGTITIAEVRAVQAGWVVIHRDQGGIPGAVIGKTFAPQGTSRNVTVRLETAVNTGDKVWPMLHIDAGTLRSYEFPGPDAPVIVAENIIMQQISVLPPLPTEELPPPIPSTTLIPPTETPILPDTPVPLTDTPAPLPDTPVPLTDTPVAAAGCSVRIARIIHRLPNDSTNLGVLDSGTICAPPI